MLGAEVVAISCRPDGRNINLNCGALHTDALRAAVLAHGADYGAAFDGDADRCMMISKTGKLIDGDHALLIAARALHAHGRLNGDGTEPVVVATVMSNLGLERALSGDGIRLRRTAVGDKYVLEEMLRGNLPLGGEQSGHVIFREFATTGDGLLTALRIIERSEETGLRSRRTHGGFPHLSAAAGERAFQGEAAAGSAARGAVGNPGDGTGVCRRGPRAGAVLRDRAAGARDGGRPVGRARRIPRPTDRIRHRIGIE